MGETARLARAGWAPLEHGAALAELRREARRAATGPGRAVFVIAPPGPARAHLLRAARRAARWRDPRLRTAFADCAALRPGRSAWACLARDATAHLRLARVALSTLADWAGVLPVVGNVSSAVVATVQRLKGQGQRRHGPRASPATAGVRLLLDQGPRHRRLLVLDRLELAEPADLAATAAFARRLPDTRTLLLVGTSGRGGRAEREVEDLLSELERLAVARRLVLTDPELDYDADDVRLRGTQVGALDADTPYEAAAALALPPRELALLELAAALGPIFSAAALAHALALPELEVEDLLAPLVRAGLLRYLGLAGEAGEETSLYKFADPVLPPSASRASSPVPGPILPPQRSRS